MGLRGTTIRLLVAGGIGFSLLLTTAAPTAADDITDAQARLKVIDKVKGDLQDHLQRARAPDRRARGENRRPTGQDRRGTVGVEEDKGGVQRLRPSCVQERRRRAVAA